MTGGRPTARANRTHASCSLTRPALTRPWACIHSDPRPPPVGGGLCRGRRLGAADNNWASLAYGNNRFAAVATSGSGNRFMTWGPFKNPANVSGVLYYSADTSSVSYGPVVQTAISANVGTLSSNIITATTVTASTLTLTGNLVASPPPQTDCCPM